MEVQRRKPKHMEYFYELVKAELSILIWTWNGEENVEWNEEQ
jgi:hypothetical protein